MSILELNPFGNRTNISYTLSNIAKQQCTHCTALSVCRTHCDVPTCTAPSFVHLMASDLSSVCSAATARLHQSAFVAE